jgi:cytosine/uracil/thiamine/allantoin permease
MNGRFSGIKDKDDEQRRRDLIYVILIGIGLLCVSVWMLCWSIEDSAWRESVLVPYYTCMDARESAFDLCMDDTIAVCRVNEFSTMNMSYLDYGRFCRETAERECFKAHPNTTCGNKPLRE